MRTELERYILGGFVTDTTAGALLAADDQILLQALLVKQPSPFGGHLFCAQLLERDV
jgi:hypothetical protein